MKAITDRIEIVVIVFGEEVRNTDLRLYGESL